MVRVQQVLDYIAAKSPPLGAEERVCFGSPEARVGRVLVCWMATMDAIVRAAAEGCQLMVVHEDLLFPPDYAFGGSGGSADGPVNRRRLGALAEAGLTVLRAHGTLDRLCILDDFGAVLGLPDPIVRDGYDRVYEIVPVPLEALRTTVQQRLGTGPLRTWGAPDRVVRRVGLAWGGLGLSVNAGFVQRMLRYEPDVLIAGEADDYVFRACADTDVALIETSHAESENPGLRHFSQILAAEMPELEVVFYENPRPWR